mmetsp:Transcript_29305/g.86829  ORF Transcript_29305/g.86829 Transcript_29305/m.86829 type:complete len:242 (+) Transcript_29305:582-1307(+)
MRVLKAGSSASTRLDVRKSVPRKYSTRRSMTETMAFRSREDPPPETEEARFSRKMSASSSRTRASQPPHRSRISESLDSSSAGEVPSCPSDTAYNGRRIISEMASAVRVLPVPGGPYRRKTDPSPFPAIMSLKVPRLDEWRTRALIMRFRAGGRTSLSKAVSLKSISESPSTRTSPHVLDVNENPTSAGQVMAGKSSGRDEKRIMPSLSLEALGPALAPPTEDEDACFILLRCSMYSFCLD